MARTRGGVGACYEIRTSFGECLYYDTEFGKIGCGSCTTTSTRFRWLISEFTNERFVRMRPASHPSRCVVYDPKRLPEYPHTFIRECASRPPSRA